MLDHTPVASVTVSRRRHLRLTAGCFGAGLVGLAAGCAGAGAGGDGAGRASEAKTAVTPLRVWFHWGGPPNGDLAQQLIATYNETQGRQDANRAEVEVVPGAQMLEKLTTASVGGAPPDVWHAGTSAKVLATAGLTEPFPRAEEQYVRQNYVPGATDAVTFNGKVWAYPTELQAQAFLYRKSSFGEVGLSGPPADVDEVTSYATKLTRKVGETYERFGYALDFERAQIGGLLAQAIALFGGEMYTFGGDKPTKVDVATPAALEAVGWWKRLVDGGVTQGGRMGFVPAIQSGQVASFQMAPFFPLIQIRNQGLTAIYEDLAGSALPARRGVKPVALASGWSLTAPRGAAQPEERWKLMRWMMHKPAMPFSRFIVETIGSLPAPKEYPTPIPGWTREMHQTFVVETGKILKAHPALRVLAVAEIDAESVKALQAILGGQLGLQTGLQQLNRTLNEILVRNNP
jgi:ABC-type glycerol-3-phosphate transport system substrate-binding protein